MKAIIHSHSYFTLCLLVTLLSPIRDCAWNIFTQPVDAQEIPTFTGILYTTNREAVALLQTTAKQNYSLQTSTNLSDWFSLNTFLGAGFNQITDSAAPYFESRYYRASLANGSNVLTGDHLNTTQGDVVIHPINHATFVMSWNTKMIYIDPVGGASPFQGMPKADMILITHSHSDHYVSSTVDLVKTTNTIIIASQEVYNAMPTSQKNLTKILRNGGITNMLDISIEALPAYNLTTSNHPKGVGNGYIVTIGGKRIYISGDTEDTPEMRALKHIDVAFLSMNTPYTMTLAKAVSATRAFRPGVAYPYHYRNSNGTYTDLNSFKKMVDTDLGIEVRLRKWY